MIYLSIWVWFGSLVGTCWYLGERQKRWQI